MEKKVNGLPSCTIEDRFAYMFGMFRKRTGMYFGADITLSRFSDLLLGFEFGMIVAGSEDYIPESNRFTQWIRDEWLSPGESIESWEEYVRSKTDSEEEAVRLSIGLLGDFLQIKIPKDSELP